MLELTPINLDEANQFVLEHHRHYGPVPGAKFCIAVSNEVGIRGVLICGRPVARPLDDGWTLEVTRCCTDGTRNACSILYGAARRAARALGYRRLVTYTSTEESGASLRAAGYRCLYQVRGRSWNCPSRPRVDTTPNQSKLCWEA